MLKYEFFQVCLSYSPRSSPLPSVLVINEPFLTAMDVFAETFCGLAGVYLDNVSDAAVAPLAVYPFRRPQTLLSSQKKPYQMFSKIGIRTRNLSPKDLTEVRAQFCTNMIVVISGEFYGRTGTLLCFN
ncbi:hypothetical protein TNCV_4631181 [Trichonephila clavipes]|nr:hypothetical protein TNCV_4631181 [Trichonephila clavipes]